MPKLTSKEIFTLKLSHREMMTLIDMATAYDPKDKFDDGTQEEVDKLNMEEVRVTNEIIDCICEAV